MKVSLAIATALGAILFIAATNLPQNTTAFYPISQYLAERATLSGKFVKVEGNVVPGSIEYRAAAMDLKFTLEDREDKGKRLKVAYNGGAKPDTLQDGITVVAAGKMGPDGTFLAKDLIVKCPSRYISTEEAKKQTQGPAPSPETGGR